MLNNVYIFPICQSLLYSDIKNLSAICQTKLGKNIKFWVSYKERQVALTVCRLFEHDFCHN